MIKLFLAVPNNKDNISLIKIAKKLKISFFAGSHNNLVNRYYEAAKFYKINPIVRFPGDNIIPEPKEIDKILSHHLKQSIRTFSSNITHF